MAVPAAPTGLTPNSAGWIATPRAQTAVTLAWQAVAGAQSYAVRVEDLTVPDLRDARNDCAGDPHFVCKNFLAGLSYPITARVGHAYRWWVHAINATGWSPAASAAFTVGEPPIDRAWIPGPLRVFPLLPQSSETPVPTPPTWRTAVMVNRTGVWATRVLTIRGEVLDARDAVLASGEITLAADVSAGTVEVTVPRLSAGRYRRRFRLLGPGGGQFDEKIDEVRVLAAEPAVSLDAGQRIRLDGVPTFPCGLYLAGQENDEHMARLAGYGYNAVVSYTFGFYAYNPAHPENALQLARNYLDAAGRHGMNVIYGLGNFYQDDPRFPTPDRLNGLELAATYVRHLRDHSALLGWYVADEPNLHRAEGDTPNQRIPKLEAMRQLLFDLDPQHPTAVVMILGPGQPAAEAERIDPFYDTADMMWVDPYPVTRSPLPMTGTQTAADVIAMRGAKPPWTVTQIHAVSNYTHDPADREPTFAEKKNMVYQALVAGAKGVILYSYFDQFSILDASGQVVPAPAAVLDRRMGELAQIGGQLRTLAPALLSGLDRPLTAPAGSPLRARAVEHGGELWVLLANPSAQAATAALTLPPGPWAGVAALDGHVSGVLNGRTLSATVAAAGGGFLRVGRAGAAGARWTAIAGTAHDIGVGPDGLPWIIGGNALPGGFDILRWTGSAWQTVAGSALRIAVGPAGPWIVNSGGNIYRRDGAAWTALPGLARDIGVGPGGEAWIIGVDPAPGGSVISRWTGSAWSPVDGGGVRIAVAPDGIPWMLNDAGAIFRRDGRRWTLLPGAAHDIGAGADGSVWITGTNAAGGGFGIYRWTGTAWQAVDGGATEIGVGPDGLPWVVNSENKIFRRLP